MQGTTVKRLQSSHAVCVQHSLTLSMARVGIVLLAAASVAAIDTFEEGWGKATVHSVVCTPIVALKCW